MRKKLVLLASVLLMGLGSGHAGRLVTDSLQSQVLGAVRHYNVYLPNGYEKETDRQYPVLYLLHGLSDTHTGWEKNGRMKIVIDELIGSGECVPMIVIMPEAGGQPKSTVWKGYFNMEGCPYERLFFEEFLRAISSFNSFSSYLTSIFTTSNTAGNSTTSQWVYLTCCISTK